MSHLPTLPNNFKLPVGLTTFTLPDRTGLNCEDSVFFADEKMRSEIKQQYLALWDRIAKKQQFIREEIGIQINVDL